MSAGATCVAIACPACMTLELARSCAGYVTTVINGCDVIPTICPATADALRIEASCTSAILLHVPVHSQRHAAAAPRTQDCGRAARSAKRECRGCR